MITTRFLMALAVCGLLLSACASAGSQISTPLPLARTIAPTIRVAPTEAAIATVLPTASSVPTALTRPRVPAVAYSQGSFTQPWTLDEYSQEKWEQEFQLMQAVGMDIFIFQWTADGKNKTTIYPTKLEGWKHAAPYDQLERGLATAQKYDIKVFMGLAFSEDWWEKQGSDRAWLMQQAAAMNQVADEIYANYYARYPQSFTGWYINWEMDNVSGYNTDASHRQNMIDALNTVAEHLHSLNPKLVSSIAPYFTTNDGMQSKEWGSFWQNLLSQTDIDVLMLQDGVGVGHAEVKDIPEWFEAVCAGVHAAGKQCWDDLENFIGESAVNHPAALERIIAQHQAAAPYVDKIVTFSFNAAMSPVFGNDAKAYDAYKAYVKTVATPVAP